MIASNTVIPGIKASHVWITESCVYNHGTSEALYEALERTKMNVMPMILTDKISEELPGAINRIHVVVTVVRNEDSIG